MSTTVGRAIGIYKSRIAKLKGQIKNFKKQLDAKKAAEGGSGGGGAK